MKPYAFSFVVTAALCTGSALAGGPTTGLDPAVGATELRVKLARGENATVLAKRYGVTIQALCDANHLANPDRLYAGQTLVIPVRAEAPILPSPFPPTEPPVAAPRAALVTDVAALAAVVGAPDAQSGAVVVRSAPLTRRSGVDGQRAERFGVARSRAASIRRAALDVSAPLRDP